MTYYEVKTIAVKAEDKDLFYKMKEDNYEKYVRRELYYASKAKEKGMPYKSEDEIKKEASLHFNKCNDILENLKNGNSEEALRIFKSLDN